MPLRSCRFVHTGGRVFFFWDSKGSIISHYESVKSLEYPISHPSSLEFIYSALILRDRPKDIKWVLYNPSRSRISAFRKLPRHETIPFELSLAGFCAVLFLSAGVTWLVRSLSRSFRKQRFQDDSFNPLTRR